MLHSLKLMFIKFYTFGKIILRQQISMRRKQLRRKLLPHQHFPKLLEIRQMNLDLLCIIKLWL